MRPIRPIVRLGVGVAVALTWSCGKSKTPMEPDETGSVRVTATTSGDDLDTGYTVAIGGLGGAVSANGATTIADVPVGARSVQLGGVAANCSVTGSNPVSVTVTAGQTVDAAFDVACQAIMVGDANAILAQAIDELEEEMFTALNAESVADLDDVSFAHVNQLFHDALDLSPSNDTAAFGAAVTGIFLLEDDPQLRQIADEWEAWLEEDDAPPIIPLTRIAGVPASLRWGRATLPLELPLADMEGLARAGLVASDLARAPLGARVDPPDISGYREVLLDVVVPALAEAAELLEEIESSAFVFTVTEAMQGEMENEAEVLELDLTEVLILRAGLEVAIAGAEIASAYSLEPNPLGAQEFVTAMTPGSTFLQLEADGAALLEEALDRLRAAPDLVVAALDNLEAESDDQSDDILKIGVDGASQEDIDEARSIAEDVGDALFSPTDITFEEGDPDELTITFDAKQFFLNPIEDLKAAIPPYEVFTAMEESQVVPVFVWQDLNLDDWDFPDPTFHGVLPGMTSERLRTDLGLGDVFFELSVAAGYYNLITIDGDDCDALAMTNGLGCQVDAVYYQGGSLNVDGRDAPEAGLFAQEQSGPPDYVYSQLYAYGPFTVTEVGEDEYSIDLELALESDGSPLPLAGLLTARPGYTSVDALYRHRGGSTIEITYLGRSWVFEKQN